MESTYVKWYSQSLGRDMEYKIYGNGRRTLFVFPSQNGRFYDYENFGMTDVLAYWVDKGDLRIVCCDSIDNETWSDYGGNPRWRIEQHERWFHYIVDELIPSIRRGYETFIVTGCSMGSLRRSTQPESATLLEFPPEIWQPRSPVLYIARHCPRLQSI